jgi:hypothetical protein
MEKILLSTEFIVVLDTNSPSFEFAEDLCAYCTGFESENTKDSCMMQKYYESLSINCGLLDPEKVKYNIFSGYVTDKMNQDGNYSPCTVWLNKKYGCNTDGEYAELTENNYEDFSMPAPFSVGIYFELEPSDNHIRLLRERAIKFFSEEWKTPVQLEGIRLITKTLYGQEKNLD